MDVLNMFQTDNAFTLASMTAAINKVAFVPGQIGASGIFEEEGVDTTTVLIEELNGQLAMVGPSPRGGQGETIDKEKRKMRPILVPHFQRDDAVMAEEVQGVRAFGSTNTLETVVGKVNARTARHARDLDTTLEHQRVGAIKGLVKDKNANTMIDLFDTFGVSAPSAVNFHLDVDTTKLRAICDDVRILIENALEATSYTGIRGYCGKTFWRNLIDHKLVREIYLNTVRAQELLRELPDDFNFGGINFERYKTGSKASAANAAGAAFIADTECRFVVEGVPGLFRTFFAPADYNETVNTIGLPRYAKQIPMKNDKGIDLEVQTNPLNICTQPLTLIAGTSS